MVHQRGSCPLTQSEQIEAYFLETRNRVLELAAFLDRLDRAPSADAADDFRLVALHEALSVLCEDGNRMQRVQMIFSDQNCELLAALDQKSAFGAAKPRS